MDEPVRRDELLAGYDRPYRRWLPLAWRSNAVPQLAMIAGTVDVATLLAQVVLVDGAPLLLVVLAVLVSLAAIVWTAWATVVAVQVIRDRTERWHARDSELARVRSRREHAGEADRTVVHDEYAVAVDDGGQLITWRFTPLRADEPAPDGEIVLPGIPNVVAREAGRTPFDAEDASRAAEQLADAQHAAAEREAAAAEGARAALRAQERRLELDAETRSTAQALRRHTGQ